LWQVNVKNVTQHKFHLRHSTLPTLHDGSINVKPAVNDTKFGNNQDSMLSCTQQNLGGKMSICECVINHMSKILLMVHNPGLNSFTIPSACPHGLLVISCSVHELLWVHVQSSFGMLMGQTLPVTHYAFENDCCNLGCRRNFQMTPKITLAVRGQEFGKSKRAPPHRLQCP